MSQRMIRGLVILCLAAACGGGGGEGGGTRQPSTTSSDLAELDPGGLGYVVHRVRTKDLQEPAGLVEVTSTCPAGKVALGAGWAALDDADGYARGALHVLEPSADGRGFTAGVRQTDGWWRLELDVTCVSASAVPSREQISAVTPLSNEGIKALTLRCPGVKKPVGVGWAGIDSSGLPVDGFLKASVPSDGNGWTVSVEQNDLLTRWRLQAWLVCVDPADLGGYGQRDGTEAVGALFAGACLDGERAVMAGHEGSIVNLDRPHWDDAGTSYGWIQAAYLPESFEQHIVCIR